jgi:hypothetical protein
MRSQSPLFALQSILALVLTSCLFSFAAQAGNVLLPDDNTNSASSSSDQGFSLPDLGLGNWFKKTIGSPSTTTDAAAPPSSAAPAAASTAAATNEQRRLSAGLLRAAQSPQQQDLALQYAQVMQRLADREKQSEAVLKPRFIDDRPDVAPPDSILSDMHESITVYIADKYLWGAGDVERIVRVFGYKPQSIPANCQLRLDGRVMTDQSRGYRLSIFAAQQATFKYTGTARKLEFYPRAVCNPPSWPLPSSGETIRKSLDGKYVIQLTTPASCTFQGATAPTAVTLQYTGDGTAICK